MVMFHLHRTVKKQEKKIDELAAEVADNKKTVISLKGAVLNELAAEVAANKKTVLSLKGAVFHGSTSPEHSVEIPKWDVPPTVAPGELVVYVHPICPFAHRAWIAALEKCPSTARFIYIDLAEKPTWFKSVCAEQTVPAIQHGPDFTMGDSMPCVNWIEEKYKDEGTRLVPDAVDEQALIQSVMDLFGKKIVMPCYTLLKNQDPAKDAAITAAVQEGMQWFEASLAKGGAPFFLGERFSVFEVACLPFFSRFRHTLKYWRGVDIMQPRLKLLGAWVQAGEARPSMKNSLRSGNYYNRLYNSYAGARGQVDLSTL